MSSLTIRLDQETDSLLSQVADLLQQSKSSLAREGIESYLKEQLSQHQARQQLEASIYCDSKEAIMLRIAESEASPYLSDEDYEKSMDAFFANELGLTR